MGKYFGTDGARGVANKELTCQLAFKLGQAAGVFMGKTIVVGRDTRLSGDMLQAAVSAGITSVGATVLDAEIIPTPAVALLVRELHADGGIVISASHNPPEYNGIKFFDGQGFKLPDAVEAEIEDFIDAGGAAADALPNGDEVGIIVSVEDAREIYINHVVDAVRAQGISFEGLNIAFDAGHGASCGTTQEALERLGATVTAINDDFTGTDINVGCGSTNLEPLHALMEQTGADFGIAHDGDADRVMMLASDGTEIDGDVVEAVCAIDMKRRGVLAFDTVVSTVMCNMGLRKAMEAEGITVERTAVGDRYVLERMREGGFLVGGEQSGHMILLEHNSTGDGLMTACQFIAACVRNGWDSVTAAGLMQRFPQVLVNVRVANRDAYESNQACQDIVNAEAEALGSDGQILVRKSGTEPLIRVMVEASTLEYATECANRIADVVKSELA